MKSKIMSILVVMLFIASAVITVIGDTDVNESHHNINEVVNEKSDLGYPSDFELLAISGGFHPLTRLFKLHINSDGGATYSKLYPEDRETEDWTVISQFDFTESEMNQIWDMIASNDFFNLNSLYKTEDIRGGTYAEMTITGDGDTNTVRTENIPVVQFDNIIKTINSITPGDNDLFYNAIFNYQPDQPSRPSGPPNGKSGNEYTYTSTASDYNTDQIYYLFNWGDETDSGWKGPCNSSETGSAKHIWSNQGNYNITVKVKDDPNGDGDLSDGKESIWSEPLPISMPKSKISKLYLVRSLEKLIQQFPMLNILQRFLPTFIETTSLEDSAPTFIETTSLEDSGTRVSIKNCTITVNIYIQIRGPGATVQLTKDIEKNIEDVWNGDWKIKCKEDCDPREPGCSVTFDAHVVRMPPGEFLPGFHDITIVNDNSADGNGHVSEVSVWESDPAPPPPPPNRVLDGPRPNDQTHPTTTGTWDANEPADTYAHEAGHLMGLDDTYPPYQNNFGDHIMNGNGAVRQEDIDLIIGMSGVECPCECCPEEEDNEEPKTDIDSPQDGSSTSSPINITGSASDIGGSGVAELDYKLEWATGSYEGGSYYIDPPKEETGFMLGPIFLENYIEIGDWIKITVYAIDAADNIGSDSITVTWEEEEEDITPPVTEKTIGEPNEEGGYIIWSYTPITFEATDDMSGVNNINYEIWWDSNDDMVVDTQMASEKIYSDSVTFTVGEHDIYYGLIELRWFAVDNAGNPEDVHYQEHYVMEG